MNIFKTFEIFLREPLSIIRDTFIQIVNMSTHNAESGVLVDVADNKNQITVLNNEKLYTLLKTVAMKQNHRAAQKLITQAPKKIVLGQLLKRV